MRVRAVSRSTASRGSRPRGGDTCNRQMQRLQRSKAADEEDDDDNDEDDYRHVVSAAMWLHVAVSADLEKSQDRKCGSVEQELEVEEALHQGSAEPHLVAMVTHAGGMRSKLIADGVKERNLLQTSGRDEKGHKSDPSWSRCPSGQDRTQTANVHFHLLLFIYQQ